MKSRFILYRQRGGMFYIEDTHTRKQESLGTKFRAEAAALLHARNESIRQPQLNLQIAKAYLAGQIRVSQLEPGRTPSTPSLRIKPGPLRNAGSVAPGRKHSI